MRALITGASGFVGRHLSRHLLDNGDEVQGTFLYGEKAKTEFPRVPLDIRDLFACFKVISDFKPDVIYHLAGVAFAPDCEKDFQGALSINVGGTYNIFCACSELKLPVSVVHISSAEVYGKIQPSDLPLRENIPPRPGNSYSLSKLMGELVIERFRETSNIRPVIIRAFNHIGPGQRHDFVVASFASQLAMIAKGKSLPVMKVGNLDAQRDFSSVHDIVRGYRLAAQKGQGVYNLCSGKAAPIKDILATLIEISGLKVTIEQDPLRMRPAEIPVIYGSYDKARAELGWEPQHKDLRAALKEVYEYWLAQP